MLHYVISDADFRLETSVMEAVRFILRILCKDGE